MSTPCVLCGAPSHDGAPVALCLAHLLEAHDWVDGEFGATDLLPAPCAFCGSRLGVRYPSGWLCAVCEWRVGEPPPDDRATARVDVVYYLRYRDRIKIGTTANPAQRFSSLPHDEVLAFERGDRMLEHRRHEQFAQLRIPGTEWFETDAGLLAHVQQLRDNGIEPWLLLARWRSEAAALGS
ncbi:GIY-YIG nuclease family protein [Leifsonia sp. fls2-241-R2A-40a]|uniref:GIY-YIG nuclease family protein n=1 Tax=Leifsonia sp. fls2-241-R2A-40a TaxID=3040290 RepID=UPI00254C2F2B|nr:GIY-YIG nuclease family protein [Leifsonia sp. fls2-241-R2A-40a]